MYTIYLVFSDNTSKISLALFQLINWYSIWSPLGTLRYYKDALSELHKRLIALWPLQLSQTVAGLICTLIKFSAWSAKLKVTDRWHLFRDLICMILFWHTSNISYWKSMPFQDPSDELHTRDKKCNMSYHYNIAYFLNFMVMFLFCMWKWYFVTKIVLTYCEKKLF